MCAHESKYLRYHPLGCGCNVNTLGCTPHQTESEGDLLDFPVSRDPVPPDDGQAALDASRTFWANIDARLADLRRQRLALGKNRKTKKKRKRRRK